MTQPTIGSFLFDYLYSKGVRHVFGIPGDFALPTIRWLDKSDLKFITMTHEPSVGFAADGYARSHGLGVACVTYCVGGLNMLNSVACAYAEKSPMIVISGGPSATDRRLDPLVHHKVKTFDTQKHIYDEVTCASTVLLDPKTAADEIIRVVTEVQAHCRPGYIEVPFDIVDMPITLPQIRNIQVHGSDVENLEAMLDETVQKISEAKQPVIVADIELHRHGLTDITVAIAKKFNIPVAATLLSKSIIDETNPLYIGVYSGGLSEQVTQEYVENSDCIILLGAFISDVFMGMHTAKLERKNTILANTEKMRVGLHSFEDVKLEEFLHGLASRDIARKNFKNPYHLNEPIPLADAERAQSLDAESFFRILSLNMAKNATLVCDTGDALLGAIGIRTTNKANFLSDAYYLSMGFAIPAAVGAMAAHPESRTYCLVGDGAFQMTGMELSTCAKYKMKPIVCILNNDGYGTQRHIIDGDFNNIHRWEYTKIRDVLNYGKAARVTTKGELEKVLKEAVDSDDMYIIEVIIPRDDCSRSLRRMAEKLGELRNPGKKE